MEQTAEQQIEQLKQQLERAQYMQANYIKQIQENAAINAQQLAANQLIIKEQFEENQALKLTLDSLEKQRQEAEEQLKEAQGAISELEGNFAAANERIEELIEEMRAAKKTEIEAADK